jgi:hypothetical protein
VYKKFKRIITSILRSRNLAIKSYSEELFTSSQLETYTYFSEFFSNIKDVQGDVIEVGFGKGNSFLCLLTLANRSNRQLIGFDSFQGFPEATGYDKSNRNPQKGDWNFRTLEEATNQVENFNKLFKGKWSLVKGFLEESLPNYTQSNSVALLHIDVDLYSGHKAALEKFFPLLSKGGLVVFDDYGEESWPGATRAVDEYFINTKWIVQKNNYKYFVKK